MKKGFLIVLTTIFLMPLQAQTNVDSVRALLHAITRPQYSGKMDISLSDACDYAIRQNRSLQNASLDVKKAHAQRWQTIAAMLPQIDGSIGKQVMYDEDWKEKMILFPGSTEPMSMSPWAYGITASVGINGQAIVGTLLQNIGIEMQEVNHEKTEAELRANVIESYISVLVLEDIVLLMDSSLQNVKRLAAHTQAMANVGACEQTQADQIQVRVNQLSNNVSANRRTLELAYNTLRVLLNVDSEMELNLTSPLSDLLSTERAMSVLLQDFSIQNNYDYQLLEKSVDLAKMNLHMAGWAYGPTVSAFYQYSYKDYGSSGGFTMMTSPNTVGLSISMPIWSSGKRAAGITEKKLALRQAKNTLNETKDNLGIQYKQLRFNLVNAYETYLTEKENLAVTERVFDNITNKYNWGASSSLELTNSSNDLITAQSTYVNAVLTLVNAEVELEKFLNNNRK